MGNLRSAGFTLIELITVIVIIGVLAVIAGPRFASTDTFSSRTFHDDVIQALRFAQAKAAATSCYTQVDFSATGFTLSIDSDCDCSSASNVFNASNVINPDGFTNQYTERTALASGTAFSSSVDPLLFDCEGKPRNTSLTLLTNTVNIDIGSHPRIKVEGRTGYVH